MTKNWNNAKSKALFTAFTTLKTAEEVATFARDLMTEAEIKEFTGRWQVAQELAKGTPQREVSKKTGVSIATVTRVNRWLKQGMGGYKLAIARTDKATRVQSIESKKGYKTPKTLTGFRDFFAKDMKIREFVINTFKSGFEKYGYEPLATPALEDSKLILGQSGEEAEKQYYRFKDPGGSDVMLRYEVMIGMCRAVAQNIKNIPLPYKRYQIQEVWRAERPQKGRFREFLQCDADTVGSSSMGCDAEFIQMGLEIVQNLGFKNSLARISNRKFLEGLAEFIQIPKASFYGFYMSLDKLKKIGNDAVITEMIKTRKIPKKVVSKLFTILGPENNSNKPFKEVIKGFQETVGKTKIGAEGLRELAQIDAYLTSAGVKATLYQFDPTLARGLASYTGPIWEFEIKEGGIGSIAGCGRYDKVIEKYTGFSVPATGGSFGIDRICEIIKERKMIEPAESPAKVLVTIFNEESAVKSQEVANELRRQNISTLLYPDAFRLDKQLKYADKKGIPYSVIAGPNELKKNKVILKDMQKKTQRELSLEEAIDTIGQ